MQLMKSEMRHTQHYTYFAIMTSLSFIAMFVLMYAMVDVFTNVYPNLNQFYMAGLMVAPMMILELLLMGSMYPNKAANNAIVVGGLVLLVLSWFAMRQQTAVGDRQFIKSMIPHHAGAILMCREAPITDAELKRLCTSIISSQQSEIDTMKRILERLGS
jgi:hypothetical protein